MMYGKCCSAKRLHSRRDDKLRREHPIDVNLSGSQLLGSRLTNKNV